MSETQDTTPALTIARDNTSADFPCCLCGQSFRVEIPWTIRAVDRPGLADVCPQCADRIEPGISGAVLAMNANFHGEDVQDTADTPYRRAADVWREADAGMERTPKPLRRFLQVDGWQESPPGLSERERHVYACHPDEDGEVTMASIVMEHRNTDFPVRLQIHEGSDKAQVLRLLGKLARWLEGDFEHLMAMNCDDEAHQRQDEARNALASMQCNDEPMDMSVLYVALSGPSEEIAAECFEHYCRGGARDFADFPF